MPPLIPKSTADANRLAGRTGTWNPKDPNAAVSPEQGTYQTPTTGGAAWEPAPATSHLFGWRLQTGDFFRKFYAPAVSAPAGTVAVLQVSFRRSKRDPSIGPEYDYYFADPHVAEKYLTDLRTAAHPGHVVQALERAGVAYKKIVGR